MDNIPTVHYKTGEVIISEGDPSNDVFLIISGKVKITKESGRKQVLLTTQGQNSFFGEMTLIDGKRRSATVTATEDTYCHKCRAIAIVKAINELDMDLRLALQDMAAIIRQNNNNIAQGNNNSGDIIKYSDQPGNKLLITVDEVESPEFQKKIQDIEPPFLRSLFRTLTATAFPKG